MVFTSHVFLFYFLPLVLAIYYVLPFRARTALIAASSYVFYGWANPIWAVLMFFGSSVDYVCGIGLLKLSGLPDEPGGLPPVIGREVPRTRKMKALLVVSIVTNLGLLAVFKYTGFVEENAERAGARRSGSGATSCRCFHVVLPVGISFYTFKAMSYAIDVYRGDARPMRRFTDYLCFEAFFPDLVAGPIIRYAALEEQMRVRAHTLDKFARGVAFFAFGMAKKILIANPMGHIADTAFGAGALHAPDAWFGLLGYAFQIYFDFSGYSDMAVRAGPDAGLRADPELRFAVPGGQHHGLLAALAHQPVDLAARLSLHPARRQSPGRAPHVREPDDGDVARRPVARRQLELRAVGRHSRRHAGVRAGAGEEQRLPPTAAAAAGRDHLLRRLPELGVLPRQDAGRGDGDAEVAVRAGRREPARRTSRRGRCTPGCTSTMFVVAALLVWRAPNTWAFTSRVTLPRAVARHRRRGAFRS